MDQWTLISACSHILNLYHYFWYFFLPATIKLPLKPMVVINFKNELSGDQKWSVVC